MGNQHISAIRIDDSLEELKLPATDHIVALIEAKVLKLESRIKFLEANPDTDPRKQVFITRQMDKMRGGVAFGTSLLHDLGIKEL